ncbi:beta-lactamase family protein [Pseudonocardia sp. DSM 110487]|uniref:serine hydrolase domain-containing protein n=1 Tax=Pseudonocardia sp. DSM 110487 TaxID=2865833 RepID=UPI001C6A13B1|nr:serine hydrolase domain-containing protein [Pseudonocardia sp. DSM 110487]QYN39813.1 beta-lactamase family protein [Pseudonocardia sp. DSM 110487]
MRIRVVFAVVLGLLVGGVGTAGSAWAAPPNALDPGAVRAFMDRVVPEQLHRLRLPGASVAVVAGGRQVFAGGYGVADLDTGRPLDDRTPVHLDSISKLFAATAAMQLVARGELDLHSDVNGYLTGFEVPDTFPGRPVTLAHLLTHTAGFEERNAGNTGATRRPLGEYLAAHQPARVRPPGQLPSYSNYGIALAGHIVELRAGVPFERYVEEHVFRSLDMAGSTFDQSATHPLRADVARNHRPDGDGSSVVQAPVPPSYDFMFPSGSAIAPAADMARFMLAELQGDARLLDDGALRAMQDRQFAVDPRLPGMGYAFQRGVLGGHPTVGHDGDGLGSHSVMALFPTLGVGVFAAVNGDGIDVGGAAGLHELLRRFADELLPPGPIGHSTYPVVAAAPATEAAGLYRYTRISTSDPSRLLAKALTDVRVEPGPDGSLTTVGPVLHDLPDRVRWVPVGERLYRADSRTELLTFGADGSYLATGDDATVAWERVSWWQDTTLHLGLALAATAGLLSTLAWPAAALVRRRRVPVGAARLASVPNRKSGA